ncbi:MAG: transposase [Okeania sp. SIO2F4]|nr:transposase [Okeania sp. SIO2F4]
MIDISLVRARCSNCGHVVEKLPLNIREWDCPECAAHHDRDINASINILRMGTRVGVRRKRSDPAPPTARLRNADQERERPRSKAAGLAVSAPVAHGGDPLWRRWQVFRSAPLDHLRVNLVYAGAKKQKVSNSDARESRAVS